MAERFGHIGLLREALIAEQDPGEPNWVRTQGHGHGLIWFRWFHPDETPERPTAQVIDVVS